MKTVRDCLWIWGHEAGSHNRSWYIPETSRMTPAEGAFYLGTPNMIMVRYEDKPEPPFEQYARSFRPLKQFVWSVVGAGGVTSEEELQAVQRLPGMYPNMTGVMMDDFFRSDPDHPGVYTPERLQDIRDRFKGLDLWVVLYQQQLHLPVSGHLARCDVVTYWTWWAERLAQLETDFEKMERLAPHSRKVLGCYMWDYGNKKTMPMDMMKHQCEVGLRWLKEGRIEGMIFLASCICDLGLETVEWTREWIQQVGGDPISV